MKLDAREDPFWHVIDCETGEVLDDRFEIERADDETSELFVFPHDQSMDAERKLWPGKIRFERMTRAEMLGGRPRPLQESKTSAVEDP